MKIAARLIVLSLLVSIVVMGPAAAFAAGHGLLLATEEPADDAGSEEPQFEEGMVPAEIAPPDAAEDTEQPWTARFLAPTLLLMGLVALIGSIAYYGVRLRSRYEVVD